MIGDVWRFGTRAAPALRYALDRLEQSMNLFEGVATRHEEGIAEYFGPGAKVGADETPFERPVCLLLFTNRSGSNYLANLLKATGGFSGLGETSNARYVINRSKEMDIKNIADYYRKISNNSKDSGPQKVPGHKVSIDQVVFMMRSGVIPKVFSNVLWIWIRREDVLAQAISFYIASQTQQWTTLQKSAGEEVQYDYEGILARLRGITTTTANTARLCGALGLDPAIVTYEGLSKNPEGTVHDLFVRFGLAPRPIKQQKVKLERQSSGLNQEFRQRFIEDARRHAMDLHTAFQP